MANYLLNMLYVMVNMFYVMLGIAKSKSELSKRELAKAELAKMKLASDEVGLVLKEVKELIEKSTNARAERKEHLAKTRRARQLIKRMRGIYLV